MQNILITGGAGFIGSNLALQLIKKGYKVRVLDNLSEQIHGQNAEIESPLFLMIKEKVDFIKGDITNEGDVARAIKGQDAIVHLAAETGTGQSMYEIKKYVDVNCGGTAILLDHLTNHTHQVKKVIVASSRAIYGEGKYLCATCGIVYPEARISEHLENKQFECTCPKCGRSVKLLATSEDAKIHPTSVYGITKQNQEQMVLAVCKSIGIAAVAFRYQNVYGPGQSLKNPYTGILSIFSTQIKNNNPINIFEDGLESRDFVYIDDVVNATILGLEKDAANNEVFNVGADEPISVEKVANSLKNGYRSDIAINYTGNFRLGDIRHNYADLNKIRQLLGFQPSVSFEQGIALFCDWVNKQETAPDNYDKSIAEMKQRGLMK